LNHSRLNHQMDVTGGVLEEQCASVVRQFFRERRLRTQ
jgi:tRNA(adenine34) deaminase